MEAGTAGAVGERRRSALTTTAEPFVDAATGDAELLGDLRDRSPLRETGVLEFSIMHGRARILVGGVHRY